MLREGVHTSKREREVSPARTTAGARITKGNLWAVLACARKKITDDFYVIIVIQAVASNTLDRAILINNALEDLANNRPLE
jgi:hypothetical protein